ncbi:hypothetical protein JZ751_019074 [Albula glossodonta]|uniref:Rho guanine nucleotide exchange factor 15 n=1 Tax=Albula glossodonta TaxID=121402 RepID=A0A8T2NR35_9TELE|nr:hypothetical protein JZ751_019074 [Albula glossodonta]
MGMGTEETCPAPLARPSLPPKPQVPPKPQPRDARWRRATDVILRQTVAEEGDPSRGKQRAKHKSLPSLPNVQSPCLSVAKNGSPLAQPAGLLDSSLTVKPLPVPKPHLQKSPPQMDGKPLPADHTVRRASSAKTLESPDSSESDGRLCSSSSESEAGFPFSEARPGCAPFCPCTCHYSNTPQTGEGQLGKRVTPKTSANSLPAVSLLSPGLEDDPHLDYWHITCPRPPGQSGRSPPNIPVPARPLPKEPEPLSHLLGKKEETDVGHPVSPVDVRSTGHPAYSKIRKPLPPIPAKPSALPEVRCTNKMAERKSTDVKERRKTYAGAVQEIVAELKEKFPSDGEEVNSKKGKPAKKRETGCKLSLLGKWSPTNLTVRSPSQNRKSPLAELMLFSLQSRESNQEVQETTMKTQSPALLESPVTELIGVVMANNTKNLPGYTPDLPCTVTPQTIPPCMGQEVKTVPVLAGDTQDTRQFPQNVIRGTSNRGRRTSLKPFWQERSIVLESGVLSQLSKQQLLLQESMYEVVTTEQSYLQSLGVAVDLFMEFPALKLALAPRDRKSLFSSIGRIREISQNFLDAMRAELEDNLFCDVCEIIQLHASTHFAAYVDYIRNMPYQEQTLHNLGKENPQIEEILRQLQEDPRCHRLPLKSFLVLPFQRITRLKILVEVWGGERGGGGGPGNTILKRTDPGSEDQASAERALREVSKVVEACNHEVGRMKQMEELVLIANKTEFECKALPLVSSSRWLVRQGELVQLTDKENIFGQRKVLPIYLFLFNDLLLVAIKKGLDRFVVQDHVHRSLIEISDGVEEGEIEAEKTSWLEALRPRGGGKDEVYEEWDCPQVQCTGAYSAQQPGELSLMLGDVLNVIQKTTDGFLEGRRLVDGERGWFPKSYVKELTNEHVQRRHLRQRYHVLQAANRVLSRRCMSRERHASTCFR